MRPSKIARKTATVPASDLDRNSHIKVLTTPADIREHRFLWETWPGSRDSDLDFFLQVVASRPEVLSPYVAVAYRGDLPQAMLVGRLERRRVRVKLGYIQLPTPEVRVLTFVYGCFRGNGGQQSCVALVQEVLETLRHGEADLAAFEHLPVDSDLYNAARTLPRFLERGVLPEQRIHWQLQLPRNSDALYGVLSPKHRQNYRRKARKFLNDFAGDVRIERYTEASDQVLAEVEGIARKTYQRAMGFGFEDTSESRERWKLAAARGWLRVSILYVRGEPCAYWNAMAYHGTLWGDQIGYDPAYASYSPGMYLLLSALSDLCDGKWDDDIARVDFGLGDAEYKSAISNRNFQESLVYVYGHTLRGLGMNLLSTPVTLADRAIRRFLERSDLLEKIKRLWRHHALEQSQGKA